MKVILLATYLFSLLVSFILALFSLYSGLITGLVDVYYFILLLWLIVALYVGISSKYTFLIWGLLFVLAILIYIIGLKDISEALLRSSFVLFFPGILQSVVEYKNS